MTYLRVVVSKMVKIDTLRLQPIQKLDKVPLATLAELTKIVSREPMLGGVYVG